MRAWLVVALALGACAGPTPPPSPVPPPEARPIERVMRERIAFEPSDKGGPPPGVAVEELGRLPGKGRWIALHDDALDAYEKAGNRLPLLYFSREAYQKAIRKLTGPQIEEAMAARLQYWSGQATRQGWRLMTKHNEALLVAAAKALSVAPGSAASALRDLMDRTLARMAAPLKQNLARGSLAEAISHVQEADVKIIADAASLATEVPGAGAIADASPNKAYVVAYDLMLDRLHESHRSLSRLHVVIERVFFLSPVEPQLMAFLRRESSGFTPWKGGAVTASPRRRIESMFSDPKMKVEKIGFSTDRFYEDAYDVTHAQADVALDETRTLVHSAPLEAVRDHWRRLVLAQTVIRKALWLAADSAASPLAPMIAPQVAEQISYLQRILADPALDAFPEAVTRIQTLLGQAEADARYLKRRAVSEQQPDILDLAMLEKELAGERERARDLGGARR